METLCVYGQVGTELYVFFINFNICNVTAGYWVMLPVLSGCLLIFSIVMNRNLQWGGILTLGAIFM
jgi:hypothetical protein